MFIIYDLIFVIFAIIYLPVFIFKKKLHRNFSRRLGIMPHKLVFRNPIWIHAVSVGEVTAIRSFQQELKKRYPTKDLIISTVTPTGNKVAKRMADEETIVTYLPLDIGFVVKKVIDRIRPSLFVLAETEIWPNLIRYLYKKNIPVVIINARISDRSFRNYRMFRIFLKPTLNRINLFCVQTQRDAQRFKALGVREDKIHVTGNMKFDAETEKIQEYSNYRDILRLGSDDLLWIAGSTHTPEEHIILKVYKNLLGSIPKLKLMIAPRHVERADRIERAIMAAGFSPANISQLIKGRQGFPYANPIFILDTVGHLQSFYAIADIVFVGGSLVKKGGHNILEPGIFARPIIFGQYMFNFRDIADLFLENKAAVMVNDAEELEAKIKELLSHPQGAKEMGSRAKELIENNRGATLKNLEYINPLI